MSEFNNIVYNVQFPEVILVSPSCTCMYTKIVTEQIAVIKHKHYLQFLAPKRRVQSRRAGSPLRVFSSLSLSSFLLFFCSWLLFCCMFCLFVCLFWYNFEYPNTKST